MCLLWGKVQSTLTEIVTVPLLLPVTLLVSTGGMPLIIPGLELPNNPPVRTETGFLGVRGRAALKVVGMAAALLTVDWLMSRGLLLPVD